MLTGYADPFYVPGLGVIIDSIINYLPGSEKVFPLHSGLHIFKIL